MTFQASQPLGVHGFSGADSILSYLWKALGKTLPYGRHSQFETVFRRQYKYKGNWEAGRYLFSNIVSETQDTCFTKLGRKPGENIPSCKDFPGDFQDFPLHD